jgi:hypothetical protein
VATHRQSSETLAGRISLAVEAAQEGPIRKCSVERRTCGAARCLRTGSLCFPLLPCSRCLQYSRLHTEQGKLHNLDLMAKKLVESALRLWRQPSASGIRRARRMHSDMGAAEEDFRLCIFCILRYQPCSSQLVAQSISGLRLSPKLRQPRADFPQTAHV